MRDWPAVAARKRALPRFDPGPLSNFSLPIRVLSVASATARRESVARQMSAAGVEYEVLDAVDGDGALPEEEVRAYVSGNRLAKFRRRTPNARYKVACDLSHLRAMHRLVGEGGAMHLVMEDDAILAPRFLEEPGLFRREVHTLLASAPADWDVLYLDLCLLVPADWAGPRVRLYARGFCTLAQVYTRAAALAVLHAARAGTRNIDNLMYDMHTIGDLQAYLADPPLVQPADPKLLPSLIDRIPGRKDPF